MPDESLLAFWRDFGDWGFKLVILGVAGEVLAAVISTAFKECDFSVVAIDDPKLPTNVVRIIIPKML